MTEYRHDRKPRSEGGGCWPDCPACAAEEIRNLHEQETELDLADNRRLEERSAGCSGKQIVLALVLLALAVYAIYEALSALPH